MSSESTYLVYAVDAGDRLTLASGPSGSRELKQVLLSFIQCPKPARRLANGELGTDEPCGFDATEFMRDACIGKPVRFADDGLVQPLQRMSGRLTLPSGEDAGELLLRKGFATMYDRPQPGQSKELFDRYTKAVQQARQEKLGVHSATSKKSVRSLVSVDSAQLEAVAQTLKGTTQTVRVERVLSATTIVAYIPLICAQVAVAFAGVQAPTQKDVSVATEAKLNTERLLLHRAIEVRFQGADTLFHLIGTPVSQRGTCFQVQLLSRGYASVNGSTLAMAEAFGEAFVAAEKEAQAARAGMWKEFGANASQMLVVSGAAASTGGGAAANSVPLGGTGSTPGATIALTCPTEFDGVVLSVLSSDTLLIKILGVEGDGSCASAPVKVSLSGVRASKNVTKDHDGRSPESRVAYADYAWEGKELLRTTFIGTKVHVKVDFARVIPETKEVRMMATVVNEATRRNAGACLLAAGFATFFLGKNDVCESAGELQLAESTARSQSVGIHSGHDAPVVKVVELSRLGESKGKYYLSFLHRGMQGNRPPVWRGVVDTVLGGGSFRVYVPKEHFQIPFKLAGIVAPSTALNPGDPSDPFATESKEFAMLHVQQREVDIQVDTVDRAGNFIGNMAVVGGHPNFAVQLVQHGFATVGLCDRLPYSVQLLAAEKAAKDAKRNIWSEAGSVPQRQAKIDAQRAAAAPDAFRAATGSSWTAVKLVDAADSATIYVHRVGDENHAAQFDQVQRAVQEAVASAAATARGSQQVPVKKGDIVCALSAADSKWYRAKVLSTTSSTSSSSDAVEVSFVDFGTRESVRRDSIRPAPKSGTLRDVPPLAVQTKLAYLKSKGESCEYADEAYDAVFEYAESATLSALCVYEVGTTKYYIIRRDGATLPQQSSTATTLNEHLLRLGVVTADKHAIAAVPGEWVKPIHAAREVARKQHLRLWKFGDADDDSDAD